MNDAYSFYPSDQVSWVVETAGIFLVNKATGTTIFLDYPRAAVWDFFTRQYPLEKMIAMLTVIAAMPAEAAKHLILECREQWVNDEFLVREANG